MRIIHTADIHLDHSFASEGLPPRLGNRRRSALRHALHTMAARAASWPADAVLIAGDLFDAEHVGRETITFLQETFARLAPIPVVIAPGNHDPFVAESPYAVETWPENVHVFNSTRWSSITLHGDLVVHGFAFDGAEISRNPIGELRIPHDERLHVAVAHASEINHLPRGQKLYCPFRIEDAVPEGLRYLALGHYHPWMRLPSPRGVVAYSGAPEGLTFRDAQAGFYLEVDVSRDDVIVTPIRVGDSRHIEYTLDCTGLTSGQELLDKVVASAELEIGHVLLRLILQGVCDPSIWGESEAIREALQSRVEHLEIVDRTGPVEDFEALSRENTSLGSFAATIMDEIRTTPAGARQQLLIRARDVGLAAFRGWEVPTRGLGRE